MAVAQWPFVAAVLLLVSSGLLSSSPLPACPEPCTCQRAPLLNCSSSGLSLVPQHIQDSVTELDLSHNLLVSVTLDRQHHYLRNVWLGNNSITRLSLCMKRDSAGRHVRGRQLHGLKPWSRQGCVSWAPTLQLLSAERNLLEELPEGLDAIESLQVLQLSFNRISTLQPGDLSSLSQLKELHLQHNLITSLHPQMFQDLAQLRVLDLSFNMLTSLHPLTYLSLRNIGADVRLDGNRWQCDCNMRSLRRRMAYDSSRGLQSWSVECASPSILSGRDLLQLEEDDLNCSGSENRPELHQDVTVHSGSKILLSCSAQDPVWWTPSGQASASQPQDDLLITDITERDTGLYVCVSEEHEVGSVFNLQISKIEGKRREPRSLLQGATNRIGQERNQRATQCNLTLAVCLSVIITFLVAFIIGVLVRPCIDSLWRRVTKKKRSTETNSVSVVEQRQYDNEAFSNGEEPEVPSSHRERRVTFSDVDISTNVQYYDTVASGDQDSVNDDAVFESEAAKTERDRHTAEDSGSESSIRQSSQEVNQRDLSNAGRKHNVEFEHIPDPVELGKRRSSSSSSDSSLSGKEDRITRRDLTRPKSPQLAKSSVQQRADFLPARKVELPQISEGSENLEFSSEPFADWSPHTKSPNLTDPDLWQENGEQFEFSDSVRSNSPRSSSVLGSFNDSKLIVAPTPNKQKKNETSSSSSSSYVSEGEPTEYTVNLDPVNEKDIESNHNKPGVTILPSLGFNRGDPQRPTGRPKGSFSSHSSDSDGKDHAAKKEKDTKEGDTQKKVVPMPRSKFRELSLGVINHGKKTRAPPPPVAHSSSSSSESEAEIKGLKVEQNTSRVNEGIKISEPKIQSTKLDPQIKRSLDIKARVPTSDSSSSSDSEGETAGHRKKQEPGQTNTARLPIKVSQTTSHAPQTQWPVLDLEHTTGIKRRLEIKVPSPASESSSSSDSEDEKTGYIKKQQQGQTNVAKLPIKVSQTNVRAPRRDSESSSSSDSEAEKTGQKQKQMLAKVDNGGHPFQASQTVNPDLQRQWPVLDLGNTAHIKRRLDIKAPSRDSDSSSSSSDSENEKTGHIKKQGQGQTNMVKLPIKASQHSIKAPRPDSESSSSSDSEAETRGQIKKQEQGQTILGRPPITALQTKIKAQKPGSESSSSSDSEAEKTGHIKKQEQGQINMAGLPIKVSPSASHAPQTQWPVLDLEHTTGIKRRLDIKVPSRASQSSSSSDSEDEKTGHIKKQEQGQANMVKLPIKASQHSIKEPKPDSDSSSSSDSEAEKTGHIKKQEQGQINMAGLPIKVSQTASYDPKTQWPVLDLEHTTRIKRRLDIKVPSRASESSSSSDSEDEKTGHIKKQEQGQANMVKLPIKGSQTNVRAPRPDSDSSSSSDSEAETTGQKQKQMLGKVDRRDPPFQVSQPVNVDLQTRWPVLDLEQTTHIKRRLEIKARSPDSKSSSSSSDSENEKTGHIKKQEQGQTNMVKLPVKASQHSIKAPRPDSESSSSSDSEAETRGQIKKQEQGQTNTARLPIKVSQTAGTYPKTQWPVLNLEHTTGVKRRLDIKAPSPDSESSSSSDSGDEQNGHIKKQEQGQANITKLPIKVSQTNVKAPRSESDSSSSSDSEAETTGQKNKQMLGKVDNRGHPIQVSPTVSPDLQTHWPVLDLGHTTRIKRRLDFKALSPTLITGHLKGQEQGQTNVGRPPITAWQPKIKAQKPGSESSSSSDSDTETTGHIKKQEQGQMNMARLPIKISPTASNERQTRWPLLDLEHTTGIKRRLDIKAPSPASKSSSSSDSEAEKTGHTKKQEQGQTNMARLPIKVSQTNDKPPRPNLESLSSSELSLGVINHGKKTRAPPPPVAHSSSSSSESEAEIKGLKVEQNTGRVNEGIKISEPKIQSTKLDPQIKRSLDIKARVPASDSSSSSDSEGEKTGQIKKQEQGQTNTTSLFTKVSHTASNEPKTRWPLLDLEHKTSIKRRLDIKAPSPASKSSSSSDSEAEKTGHMKIQEQKQTNMAGLPIKISQTNVKAPTPDSKSSSSSDSEAEKTGHKKKQEQGQTNMARLPIKISQTNVKAPRPNLDSSSSSDSEAETGQIKKQEQGQTNTTSLFTKVSHTASNEPQTRWPLLDLEHKTSIKRRLDIKAPSPASKSSSSSDSEAEKTGHMKIQEQKQTNMAGLPIKISQTNVKAPTPDSESSSSSDSEAEKTGHKKKQEQGQTNMARLPIKISQTNVKAPRPDLDSSSSSDSEAETGQIKKQEQGQTNTTSLFTKVSHTASNEPQTRWPLLDLEHKTSIKRHLDIKAPSPASESSSSSDSEDETTHHTKKEKPELLVIAGLPFTVSQTVSRDPDKQWPAVDLGNTTRIKRRLDIKAPSPTPQALVGSVRDGKREEAIKVSSSSSSSSSDEQESSDLPLKVERDRTTVGSTNNPLQTKLPDLDKSIPMVKRRLDIKAPSPQPDPIQSRLSHGSQQSNSSTSDSEDENHTRQGLSASTISKTTEKKFNWSPKIPVLHTSRGPQTDHDIKLSKYTVITDGVGDKTSDNINTAPVVTPELESRWASMNLGISRFRKRLEITPHEPSNLPSSPPPDSPTSRTRRKRWGVGFGGITHTQSSITLEKASPILMGQDDNSVESKDRLRIAYSLPVTEEKSTTETMLTSSGNPHLKKYLDIKGSEKAAPPLRQRSHSSSSSDSENASTEHAGKGGRGRSQLNDTIDHSLPALSLGVQHTNRNLNIKAPSSKSSSSSSSSSENEHEGTGYTAKQSRHSSDMLGVTENNSLITYKRQIFSSPTPDHTNQIQMGAEIVSVTQGGPLLSVGIRDESLAPRRVPSMNFEDVVKKRIEQSRHTTDVDLPPEIRWTGIGRQPSDLSISSTRRTLDINLSTPSAQPELHLLDSFNYSSNKSDDGTLRYEYSSLSTKSVHLASSRAIDEFDNLPDSLSKISKAVPEDRRQSKGLSALKAMSSERRKWETQAEHLDTGASPLFDDLQLDSFYNRRPEKEIKPPEKRATDLLYDIPRYRRHDIGGIGQLQETPPPMPATPPPDVAVELQWGSPQSSMKQGFAGTRSHLQLNRNRVEPDPSLNTSQILADYFDPINTNISHV